MIIHSGVIETQYQIYNCTHENMIFEEGAFKLEKLRQDQQIIYNDIVGLQNAMHETI